MPWRLVTEIIIVVGGIIALFYDPSGKYRKVIIACLEQVKEVTDDNVDAVINMIISALKREHLNPESRVAKKMFSEVRVTAGIAKKRR